MHTRYKSTAQAEHGWYWKEIITKSTSRHNAIDHAWVGTIAYTYMHKQTQQANKNANHSKTYFFQGNFVRQAPRPVVIGKRNLILSQKNEVTY